MNNNKKNIIKKTFIFAIILIFIIFAFISLYIYKMNGEKSMPFNLKEIMIVSTADGIQNLGTSDKWNFNIVQNNDFYITIEKNENFKNEEINNVIDSVEISNIQIVEKPKNGNVFIYKPSSNSNGDIIFNYDDQFKLTNSSLIYKGASKSDDKTLQIGNEGGQIKFRISNFNLGTYISNDDNETEITYDGSIIKKLGLNYDDIKFKVNFDLIINLKNNVSYKTNININLPCDDILETGKSNIVLNNDDNKFVFHRV